MGHREGAPDPSCAPTETRGTLDFGWWASNGPTAGYLMRLALDAIGDACGTDAGVRRIELRVSRLASAGPFELAIAGAADPADIELLRLTFDQGRPFATATVLRAWAAGAEVGGDASPPAALPRDAYRPMGRGVGHTEGPSAPRPGARRIDHRLLVSGPPQPAPDLEALLRRGIQRDRAVFAVRLGDLRVRANMTHHVLVKRAEIHPDSVRKYESGDSEPTLGQLVGLVKALDLTSLEELFGPLPSDALFGLRSGPTDQGQ